MKYAACGNVMVDQVVRSDGTLSRVSMGGPSFFALTGMKLWTDDCFLRSNIGKDFEDYFGEWFENNNMTRYGTDIMSDHGNNCILTYNEDGSYSGKSKYGVQNMGYMRTTPEQMEKYCKDTVGVYIAQDTDPIVLNGFLEVRDKCGFKIMWEIEARWALPERLETVKKIAAKVDMFSMNLNEAVIMYGLEKDDEIGAIKKLKELGVPFIFFRVGKKGSYVIEGDKAYFIPAIDIAPPVDSTGCGNCSTGCATYAWAAGYDAIMCGIMSNIAAAYNVIQYGPYLNFDEKARSEAMALAKKIREEYKGEAI